MPKIQRFISERLPPGTSGGVPVSPQLVGMEAGAIARAGEKIEQTGLYAANVFAIQAERDKRAEEANIAGKVKIGLENDKDILLETWKQSEDYQNSEKSVDEWVKNAREKYEPMSKLKDGGESETLAQGIDLYISHTTNDLKKIARDRYREGLTRETKANWITQKDFYIRDYANATTPEEKTIVRNNMEIEARELGKRMILWPEEVEKEVKSFDKDAQVATIINATNSDNINIVNGIIQRLDDKKSNEFNTLDATEKATARANAERHLKILKKEKEGTDDEIAINNAYYKLKKQWGNSYDSIYTILSDSDWQKSNNITPKRKHSLEIMLKAEQTLFDSGIKKMQDDNSNKNLLLLSEGNLTIPMINNQLRKGQITDQAFKYFQNELEGKEAKTNLRAYDDILSTIDSVDPTKPETIESAKNKIYNYNEKGFLSRGDGEKSLNLIRSKTEDKAIFSDPWFIRSERAIKEGLGWTEQMGFSLIFQKEGTEAGLKTMNTSSDLILKLVKAVKEEKLKNEEIFIRAKQMALGSQQEFWNLLMGGKKEEVKKKEPEKYNVGQVYNDAQGRRAKYLGAGKWEMVK